MESHDNNNNSSGGATLALLITFAVAIIGTIYDLIN